MTVIKLLSQEIPKYWELIKWCECEVNNSTAIELVGMLHDLLNDTAQCWIRLDKNTRQTLALMITTITVNKYTGKKTLTITCLYSWKMLNKADWQHGRNMIIKFAQQEKCSEVDFRSSNERLWEIARGFGFKEKYRVYSQSLEG